jgi:hypothetical protein
MLENIIVLIVSIFIIASIFFAPLMFLGVIVVALFKLVDKLRGVGKGDSENRTKKR